MDLLIPYYIDTYPKLLLFFGITSFILTIAILNGITSDIPKKHRYIIPISIIDSICIVAMIFLPSAEFIEHIYG